MNDEILLDAHFLPDPDAAEELSSLETQTIADEEIRHCRLLLVRRAVEPLDVDGGPAGAVQLVCSFHPVHNARFVWARLSIQLTAPDGARIIDLAPREVNEDKPVEFTITDSGTIGVEKVVSAEIGKTVETKYAVYYCRVQGSGESTPRALWTFREHPKARQGLPGDQQLILTLAGTGEISAQVSLSAKVARRGLAGGIDVIRDLILGHDEQPPINISFSIPEKDDASLFQRIFRRK